MESFQIFLVIVLMIYFNKHPDEIFLYCMVSFSLVAYVYAVVRLNRKNGEEAYENAREVVKTEGVERRRSATQERMRRLYGDISRDHDDIEGDDSVDISEEARKRSDGTYRKSILEHLEDD